MEILNSFKNHDSSLYEFQALTGDSSPKKIYRVLKSGHDIFEPKSYILIKIPITGANSDEFFVINSQPLKNQADFFIEILDLLSKYFMKIPRLEAADPQTGLVLLTDLGDLTLDQCWYSSNLNLERDFYMKTYYKLVEWLGTLHQLLVPKDSIVYQRIFERQAMHLELEDFLVYGLKAYEMSQNDQQFLAEFLEDLCIEITKYPERLIHRDFQARNIMIYKKQPFVIDFQDLCLGPFLYDLASLLYDANASLTFSERLFLASLYRRDYCPTFSMELFWEILTKTALQRILKNLGRHAKYYAQSKSARSLFRVHMNYDLLRIVRRDLYKSEFNHFFKLISQRVYQLFLQLDPELEESVDKDISMSSNQVVTIILAAGKGTRMKSDLPKVLHPVGGKPMIQHVIEVAEKFGSQHLYPIVGYQKELVQEQVHATIPITFVEQVDQLGTAHAVHQAAPHLVDYTGSILVLSGDVPLITPETLQKMISVHESGVAATILTEVVENPIGCGRIIRDSVTNEITEIIEEKDITSEEVRNIKEVNTGIYLFDAKTLFETLPLVDNKNAQNEYYLTDVIKILCQGGKILRTSSVLVPGETQGVNTLEQLEAAEQHFKKLM